MGVGKGKYSPNSILSSIKLGRGKRSLSYRKKAERENPGNKRTLKNRNKPSKS